eukprot:GFKZ01014160.1.p1 GENE.GFKZ01014160.1~~GFKZ01014160.1.p1  ORF type:complete len:325 (-),score=34.12 GFKZ01014160.1:139-1113(-)
MSTLSPSRCLLVLFLSYLFLLLTSVSAQRRFRRDLRRCGHFCRFRMCQLNPIANQFFAKPVAPFVLFGNPQLPDSPTICSLEFERNMDIVEEAGEAFVFDFDTEKFIPISKWRPEGLSHPFHPRIIGPYKVRSFTKSGIALSERLTGNQWSFLHDRCMILPIRHYKVASSGGLRRISTENDPTACAAFKITAPELRFHLFWDTGDDLDLVVEEPDGDVIDFRRPTSESGKLNLDENRGLCNSHLRGGRENVLYLPGNGRQDGKYVVEGFLVTKCTSQRTNWRLNVLFRGEEVMSVSGFFNDTPSADEQVFLFKKEVHISLSENL